jgi:hypothetical protein
VPALQVPNLVEAYPTAPSTAVASMAKGVRTRLEVEAGHHHVAVLQSQLWISPLGKGGAISALVRRSPLPPQEPHPLSPTNLTNMAEMRSQICLSKHHFLRLY